MIIHTLSDKNSLTALGIPCIDNKTFFVWYIFAEPILEDKINGGRLRTQAGIYSFREDDQMVLLRSLSVNGSLVPHNGSSTILSDPCGGCVSPVYGPWNYYSTYCDHYNGGCLVNCCRSCAAVCMFGPTAACFFVYLYDVPFAL